MPDSATLPVSLSVLVLAWDEAAPAVATLLEATPADPTHPLLVLLPPAPLAPAEATQAAANVALAVAPAPIAAAPDEASQVVAPAVVAVAGESSAPGASAAARPQPAAPATAPTSPAPAAGGLAATLQLIRPAVAGLGLVPAPAASLAPAAGPPRQAPPAPASPIRIVRLDYTASLVGRSLTGNFRSPAAPYLGASEVAGARLAAAGPTPASELLMMSATAPEVAATEPAAPASSPAYFGEEEVPQAPDLEADLLPLTPEASAPVLATFAGSAGPGAPTPLPGEAEALVAEATVLPPNAPAVTPGLDQPAANTTEASEAMATNAAPVAADEPAPTDTSPPATSAATEAKPAATLPDLPARATLEATEALTEYPAPDLNTQVIRYARFGVPAALAEQPFEVIYAPAWPTWLAAAELRQRTGCPLVLHLRTLAAGRQPADTAAGWPAEIQRQVLRQADLVLAETYALARRLRRELGLANGAVRVVSAADGTAVARALRRAQRR